MGLLDRLFGGSSARTATITITYRVAANETCRSIAKKFYGDEAQWERVYEPNRRRLEAEVQTGTDVLPPGTEVTIENPLLQAA